MNSIIFCICSLLAAWAVVDAQFAYPLEGNDLTMGKLFDPFLVRALKSQYPQKCISKLGNDKDLVLNAKYKLAARKLARHLKNLGLSNYPIDFQNVAYDYPRSMIAQPVFTPEQSTTITQQQAIGTFQNPCDQSRAFGIPLAQQPSGYPITTDQSLQQPIYQLSEPTCENSLRSQQIFSPEQSGFSMRQ